MRFFKNGDRVRVVHGIYRGKVGTVTDDKNTRVSNDIYIVVFDDVASDWALQFDWKLRQLSALEALAAASEI